MTVNSNAKAWMAADEIIHSDYTYDAARSARAGYPVYFSTDGNEYICDLGDRLEVNTADGKSVNIWIRKPQFCEYQFADALAVINDAIYEIDDKVCSELEKLTGIQEARDLLYGAYGKIAELLEKDYPESYLIERYNLKEA